jgi:hypothetical protein
MAEIVHPFAGRIPNWNTNPLQPPLLPTKLMPQTSVTTYLEVLVHDLVARLPLDRPHTQNLAQVRLVQVVVDILRPPITGLEHEHLRINTAWISDQKRPTSIPLCFVCLFIRCPDSVKVAASVQSGYHGNQRTWKS